MAQYLELPNDEFESQETFQRLLDTPDETVILILGEDDTSQLARDHVQAIVDDNQGNNDIYQYLNFLVVPNPEFILSQLRELENKTGQVLDNLDEYVIVSISPFKNILSEAVTKERFLMGRGSVSTAIIKALANG